MPPTATDAVEGVSVMLLREGLVTVSTLVPVTPPEPAVIVAVPAATPVATPAEEMVAMAELLLVQVTVVVQVELVPFEYVQVAVKDCVPEPTTSEAVEGETVMPVRVAAPVCDTTIAPAVLSK